MTPTLAAVAAEPDRIDDLDLVTAIALSVQASALASRLALQAVQAQGAADPDVAITAEQAARRLGISIYTLYDRLHNLEAYRDLRVATGTRMVRISARRLDQLLERLGSEPGRLPVPGIRRKRSPAGPAPLSGSGV